jgi:hypothetical protein
MIFKPFKGSKKNVHHNFLDLAAVPPMLGGHEPSFFFLQKMRFSSIIQSAVKETNTFFGFFLVFGI